MALRSHNGFDHIIGELLELLNVENTPAAFWRVFFYALSSLPFERND